MQDTLPIHFAPLQGYTEAFYRNAHAKYSYDWKEEIPVAEMSGESNLRRIRSPT